MTTTQDRVRAMGIYKCPAEVTMEVFKQKCEEVLDCIAALPVGHDNILKYEMFVPNRAIDEHLVRYGLPSPQDTIVIVAEFAALENLDKLLLSPEVKQIMEAGKANISMHLDSCSFAFDVITKIDKAGKADERQGSVGIACAHSFVMKFSSSLKFNAVAEWWNEYIAYDVLKKCIYQLERTQHEQSAYRDIETNERSPLLNRGSTTDAVFTPLLDRELKKICVFYEAQEQELKDEVAELEELVRQQEEAGMSGNHYLEDDGEDEEDDDDSVYQRRRRVSSSASRRLSLSIPASQNIREEQPVRHRHTVSFSAPERQHEASTGHHEAPSSPITPVGTWGRLTNKLTPNFMRNSVTSSVLEDVWTSDSEYAYDTRLLFKRRITTLFISVASLKSYVDVNYSGFRKILKKYDKVMDHELKEAYLHAFVEPSTPFTEASRATLTSLTSRLVDLYAKCVTRGDRQLAKRQLRLHQRENIAWERDTVWRQMIGRERRGDGDADGLVGASLLQDDDALLDGKPGMVLNLGFARLRVTKKKIALLVSIAVFVALLNTHSFDGPEEANRCYAVLMFCTLLWATEAIPLFVTSLMVPLLLVVFSVIRDNEGTPLPATNATKYIFSVMFSPTIMLLIGGFTISSALSKTNIDRVLITRVLSLAGTRPSTVLLAFMGVSCFASMWISNVAAPTLCFTLIRPILRTLPPKSSFAPCLILAIALAANIGGQSSPISSPQNLIALKYMDPPVSWGQWFIVALPVSFISIVLIWGLLLISYKPARAPGGGPDIEIKLIRPTKERFTVKQWWVTFVCLGTITLWCVAQQPRVKDALGDMGVIAIIPIVAFFATGVLKKDDFEQFAWTIVFLAMGGIALGEGVTQSGLRGVLDAIIRNLLHGVALGKVILILSPVVLIISTFISHTIASVLLVPIAKQVGSNFGGPGNPANLLIFLTGLICSAGMGMPVSGFPNQTAATQEDDLGVLYLTNVDFLKNGVPASIIATVVVATVGLLLMKAIGL
ncbi:SPX domain-containing protein [Mycena venus]|uniref:SPX domain-containing protein n=1 Tax=Mycena venus TaxID=2733690 RepID=A0A8H7CFI3_9AGAR|nr:SPX domain-containing protein [Mycena venus]